MKFALLTFHVVGAERANGRPAPSTLKKLTRFCDGWWKPQQPNGLPECGKFNRSPQLALLPSGSPSFADAWNARMVSTPLSRSAKPVQTRSKLVSRPKGPFVLTSRSVVNAAFQSGAAPVMLALYTSTRPLYALAVH